MTDTQVITECIKIAQENGWKIKTTVRHDLVAQREKVYLMQWVDLGKARIPMNRIGFDNSYILETLLFNHDFAKALFGEFDVFGCTADIYDMKKNKYDEYNHKCLYDCVIPAWQYHIQQLALSPDRIDYLRNWLHDRQ